MKADLLLVGDGPTPRLHSAKSNGNIGRKFNLREGCFVSYYFEFDATNKILGAHFEGRVTDHELKEYYRAAGKYLAKTAARAAITDFSDVTSFKVSPKTIRELAELPPAMPDPRWPRVIVAPAAHIFGIARMFQLQGESTRPNLHVVTTLKEAWAVLGVQKVKFERVRIE